MATGLVVVKVMWPPTLGEQLAGRSGKVAAHVETYNLRRPRTEEERAEVRAAAVMVADRVCALLGAHEPVKNPGPEVPPNDPGEASPRAPEAGHGG